MGVNANIRGIEPVLPSRDISRDLEWHEQYTGFTKSFGDHMYAGISRDQLCIHLQWHADNEDDPLLGGSVIKIFVNDLSPFIEEFIKRGTIEEERVMRNTPWGTHEFGFHDLNKNAIYFVQDI